MNYLRAKQVAERAQLNGQIDPNAIILQVIPRKGLIEVRTRAKSQRNPNQFYGFLITEDGINLEAPGKPSVWFKDGLEGPYHGDKIAISHPNKGYAMDLVVSVFGHGHKYVYKTWEQSRSNEKWKTSNHYVVDLR